MSCLIYISHIPIISSLATGRKKLESPKKQPTLSVIHTPPAKLLRRKGGTSFLRKWGISTNCEVSDGERIPRNEGELRSSCLVENLWSTAGSQRVLPNTTACGQRNLSILWVNVSGRGWDAGRSRDPAVSHSWPAAGFLSC